MFVMHVSKIVIKAKGDWKHGRAFFFFSDTNIKMVVDCWNKIKTHKIMYVSAMRLEIEVPLNRLIFFSNY